MSRRSKPPALAMATHATSVADFHDSPFVALLKRENERVAQIAERKDAYSQVTIGMNAAFLAWLRTDELQTILAEWVGPVDRAYQAHLSSGHANESEGEAGMWHYDNTIYRQLQEELKKLQETMPTLVNMNVGGLAEADKNQLRGILSSLISQNLIKTLNEARVYYAQK